LNFVKDFVPNGGAVTLTREVSSTAACNECHDKMAFHGSRTEMGYCVTCHSRGVEDTLGNNVDMGYMIHAIHGASVRAANGGPEYEIYSSYWRKTYKFGDIVYPQAVTNCLKCHDAAVTSEGGHWNDKPTYAGCKGCHEGAAGWTGHDNIAQLTPTTNCTGCHRPAGNKSAMKSHPSVDNSPNAVGVVEGAANFVYNVKSAVVNQDNSLDIVFQILRDGESMDLVDLPSDLTGGPSFLLAYAMPQDGIAEPVDYNNLGRTAAQPSSVSLANLRSGTLGSIEADTEAGFYLAKVNAANAFPAGATLRAVGLQGYFTQALTGGSTLARHTPASHVAVTGDAQRRVVVDDAKCANCHEWYKGHGGNRVYAVGVCVMCHVPNLSTSGASSNIANLKPAMRDALAANGYDPDNPLTYPESTNNMKEMTHAIHAASVRTTPYEFVRNSGTRGINYYNFADVGYPAKPNNCLMCHKPGTFTSVPAGALATNFVTDNGAINTPDDADAARETVPNTMDEVVSPFASSCIACHDTPLAAAHMAQNGAFVYGARGDMGNSVETCALCHGPGRSADIVTAHGL
jgi:OmcA/MtrC family decaheme c-type cytochrome